MQKQRSWGDCGIATLLNAVADNGFTYFNGPGGYERLVDLFEGRNSGITIQEVSATLFFCGFIPLYLPLNGFRNESGITDAHVINTDIMDAAMKGKKAVFQVKTKSGLLHLIYFDGKNIHDPSPSAPDNPDFSNYKSVIDGVFLFDKYYAGGIVHGRPSMSSSKPTEKTAAQKIAEYEAAQKIAKHEAAQTITITNTIDASSVAHALESSKGEEMIMSIIRANRL